MCKKLSKQMMLSFLSVPAMVMLLSCSSQTPSSGKTETQAKVAEVTNGGAPLFCAIAKPLTWSPGDTPETILQIKQANCRGSALCSWGGAAEAASCK